jgi:hypothetical protein
LKARTNRASAEARRAQAVRPGPRAFAGRDRGPREFAVAPGIGIGGIEHAPDIPRLLVQPLEDFGGVATSAVARGLTHEIVGQLAKFKDIMVVEQAPISESTPGSESRPQRALPRYALAGAIDLSENSLRLQVRLLDRGDGGVL